MRDALKNAIHNAILFECKLPHQESGLDKSCLSSQNDICFSNSNPQEISKIIYNGIVEFAINEYEIDYTALEREQRKAILSRIRYNPEASEDTKLKYGFYGEVLLDLILRVFLNTSVLAARGYFYSPIENSEAKGFDAFHLMEREGNIDLWFGEAKFYVQYKSAITPVMEKLSTSLSDGYLNRNLLAIIDERLHISTHNEQLENLLNSWEENPDINLSQEIKNRGIRLIYPIFITKDKYLSEVERQDKEDIQAQIIASEIPSDVFDCFRVVGPKDKLTLYSYISSVPWWTIEDIKRVSITLAGSNAHRLYWPGFQAIMDIILPVVREEKLKQLIVIRVGQNQYSLITNLLSSYLSGGFLSMVQYYVGRKDNPKTKDEAMRQVADFVYNVFKYHLVKYLGLFDVFFRYQISKSENISMEDVAGLGLLLQKLEYNALSPNARKVSDYGVPFKLIDCYDSKTPYDKGQFDAYEQHIDQEINRLFQ